MDARERLWVPLAARVRAVGGVIGVQRLCCGTCLDYKLLLSVGAAQHGAWAESEGGYEGSALGVLETAFLEALRATEGVVEATAQLYSISEA